MIGNRINYFMYIEFDNLVFVTYSNFGNFYQIYIKKSRKIKKITITNFLIILFIINALKKSKALIYKKLIKVYFKLLISKYHLFYILNIPVLKSNIFASFFYKIKNK